MTWAVAQVATCGPTMTINGVQSLKRVQSYVLNSFKVNTRIAQRGTHSTQHAHTHIRCARAVINNKIHKSRLGSTQSLDFREFQLIESGEEKIKNNKI